VAIAIALALAAITLAVAHSGADAASPWRHAYHVPVVVAALRYGRGGVLTALAAVLLYAPFVLPALEREGPTPAVLEGLLTFALLLGVGVLSAALAGGVRRQRARYETLATVQRALDGDTPLDLAVARLRACLHARLDATVGLALENARLTARQRRFADELAEKVTAATRHVVEMDRMKSEFVAIASHELRTPLTALQGFSELLAMRQFAPAELARIAAIMRAETERLGRIVNDFLDLARLERGLAPSLRLARVDAGALIADAVEVLQRARTTHHFEVDCADGLPPLEADPDALDRVVKNLVSNAVKYSPAGSRVRVTARAQEAPPAVEITVEDEGPGIAEADRTRIFEPYYRTMAGAKAAGGAGLGLAVVKSLIDAHGGTIRADNVAPHGTRMTLILPAVP